MEQSKGYAPLTKDDFFKVYEKSLNLKSIDDFFFITKGYFLKDDVVAVYKEELLKDCFFQLPDYRTGLIPEERKSVYYLPKNKGEELSKAVAPDGRFKIPVGALIKLADPYSEDKTPINPVREQKEVVEKAEMGLDELVDNLCNLSKTELLGVLNAVLVRKL